MPFRGVLDRFFLEFLDVLQWGIFWGCVVCSPARNRNLQNAKQMNQNFMSTNLTERAPRHMAQIRVEGSSAALWGHPHVIWMASCVWGTSRIMDLHFPRWNPKLIAPASHAGVGGRPATSPLLVSCTVRDLNLERSNVKSRTPAGILGKKGSRMSLFRRAVTELLCSVSVPSGHDSAACVVSARTEPWCHTLGSGASKPNPLAFPESLHDTW